MNRAVSGNRVVDVYARIKADIINLKPDVISFLIGINDVWHEISRADGVDALKFEKIYTMLLEEIRTALPQTKMILLAPYVLKGEATENTEEHPDRWNRFCMEVPKRIAAVERLGKKFDLSVIHLQEEFNRCAALPQNNSYWARDGVHPTKNGHELIARQWLSLFQTL